MKVMVAESLGYCYGVRRAEHRLIDALDRCGRVKTYGPLINNAQMTSLYVSKGAQIVSSLEEINPGETMVIRSHGVPLAIYEAAHAKDISIVDATCPFVSKIHSIVQQAHQEGSPVVIFGSAEHPEVIGINGWCGGAALIVTTPDSLPHTEDAVVVVVQTTFQHQTWLRYRSEVLQRMPNARIYDTVCSATSDRQEAAVRLAHEVDRMIVVGDRHSSNTRKLVELCAAITPTLLIETKDELDLNEFDDTFSVGITAGASTPDWIIDAVIQKIEEERTIE